MGFRARAECSTERYEHGKISRRQLATFSALILEAADKKQEALSGLVARRRLTFDAFTYKVGSRRFDDLRLRSIASRRRQLLDSSIEKLGILRTFSCGANVEFGPMW